MCACEDQHVAHPVRLDTQTAPHTRTALHTRTVLHTRKAPLHHTHNPALCRTAQHTHTALCPTHISNVGSNPPPVAHSLSPSVSLSHSPTTHSHLHIFNRQTRHEQHTSMPPIRIHTLAAEGVCGALLMCEDQDVAHPIRAHTQTAHSIRPHAQTGNVWGCVWCASYV